MKLRPLEVRGAKFLGPARVMALRPNRVSFPSQVSSIPHRRRYSLMQQSLDCAAVKLIRMMKKFFSGWIVISLGVLLRLPWCWNVRGALPDLTIYGPAANPHVVYRSFASNDCAVNEGCVEPGTRALLALTTQTRDVG